MIGSTRNVKVYAVPAPVDMRKGFDGLFAVARDIIKQDPLSGHMFLFVGKNRRRAKILFWDGTGLCILHKRLDEGRFVAPWQRDSLSMTQAELALFLEGSKYVRETLSPSAIATHNLLAMR